MKNMPDTIQLNPTGHWAVPAYRTDVLRPRRARYAVCVFVINEGERIRRQLERMQAAAPPLDVVLADGGSTDGSTDLEVLKSLGVSALLTKQGPGKLSAQMRMALSWCLEQGYEGVVVMDGNNKDDPAALTRFADLLAKGWDHVQGSRFIVGGRAVNTPWQRLLGIKLLHAPLISLASGYRYTDTTNGFRAYSRRLLVDPRVAPFREVFSQYELHYYLAIRAAQLGFRVTETPVCREYPAHGGVPTKIHGWRGNALVLRTLWAACRGKFNPPPATMEQCALRKAA
jgi:glycosyltransferase involved in cell wall biosynthesis